MGTEPGQILALLGSESASCRPATTRSTTLLDRHRTHPLATYARLVKGVSAVRDFKCVTADKELKVVAARPDESITLLSAVEKASKGDEGVDNITLNFAIRRRAAAEARAGDPEKAAGRSTRCRSSSRPRASSRQSWRRCAAKPRRPRRTSSGDRQPRAAEPTGHPPGGPAGRCRAQLRQRRPRGRLWMVGVLDGSESGARYPIWRPVVNRTAWSWRLRAPEDPLVGPLRREDFRRAWRRVGRFDAGRLATFDVFAPVEAGEYVYRLRSRRRARARRGLARAFQPGPLLSFVGAAGASVCRVGLPAGIRGVGL